MHPASVELVDSRQPIPKDRTKIASKTVPARFNSILASLRFGPLSVQPSINSRWPRVYPTNLSQRQQPVLSLHLQTALRGHFKPMQLVLQGPAEAEFMEIRYPAPKETTKATNSIIPSTFFTCLHLLLSTSKKPAFRAGIYY